MRRMRRTYASRRDALVDALRYRLGDALDFRVPPGGTALWARADDAIDVPAWVAAAEREGVRFASARAYDFAQRDERFMRLGFSYHDEAELDEAARRLASALAKSRTPRTSQAPARRPAQAA